MLKSLFSRGPASDPRRHAVDRLLAALPPAAGPALAATTLVDGTWDNPNYWARYSLLRAALGLRGTEVGLLGQSHAKAVQGTFKRLGARRMVRFTDFFANGPQMRAEARRRLAQTTDAREILQWDLDGVPGHDLYDGLLKVQRHAQVRLDHPAVEDYLTDYLQHVHAVARLLDAVQPDLVVLSHTFSGRSILGPLAWTAARRGIATAVLFGNYGTQRFAKVRRPQDVYDIADCPRGADLDDIPEAQADALAAIGRQYLEERLRGRATDIAAQYAFSGAEGPSRDEICTRFGWNPQRPIVAVYASTWFDAPHSYGMTRFRDFAEWIQATAQVARAAGHVSWLFRGHPCDAVYQGITLKEILPVAAEPHVRLCPPEWTGGAVQHACDAVVTLQGTAGVEYAASGKAALLADRSWYHDCGFAHLPASRDAYLQALTRNWWEAIDLAKAKRRAQVFAGWYFCRPSWHEGFLFQDDSRQGELYDVLPRVFEAYPHVLRREIDGLRSWYQSAAPHYHTFKMRATTAYALPTTSTT